MFNLPRESQGHIYKCMRVETSFNVKSSFSLLLASYEPEIIVVIRQTQLPLPSNWKKLFYHYFRQKFTVKYFLLSCLFGFIAPKNPPYILENQ